MIESTARAYRCRGNVYPTSRRVHPEQAREIVAGRDAYRDKKGKENTGQLKDTFGNDDLLVIIRNICGVLLTRRSWGPTYAFAIRY